MKQLNRVAIVHEYLENLGGAERVLKQLLEIFPKADLFFITYNLKKLPEDFRERFKSHKITVSFANRFRRFTPLVRVLAPKAVESFNLNEYDLVISNCNSYAKGVIVPTNTYHISYVHSPTRYLWDYKDQYLDEHGHNFFTRFLLSRLFFSQRKWDFLASRRPDLILANSRNVQSRIKKYYRLNSKVLLPAVDLARFKPISKKKGNYFLFISRLSPYKKADLAIKAFKTMPHLNLKIAGSGSELDNLKQMAKGADNIEFLGFVPDSDLPNLYANARALIFPQLEDFGLVPIESMASGTPVIAYGKGGVLETVNQNTGIFFSAQTAKSLNQAVLEFLNKEKSYDDKYLISKAQQFSFESFKKNLLNYINQLLDKDERNKNN